MKLLTDQRPAMSPIKNPVRNGVIGAAQAGFTEEYQAVYDAFITKPSAQVASDQNAVLVKPIVDYGTWAKLDFFHLEGGHINDNGESFLNWITPSTNDLYIHSGSPNFLASNGFKGDGIADLLKNNYILDGNGKYKQDDACLGIYIMDNIEASGNADFGYSGAHDSYLRSRYPTNNSAARLNDNTNANAAITDSSGMVIISRPAINKKDYYKNGVLIFDGITPSTGLPNAEMSFLGTNSEKSTRRQGCVFGGAGLNETDAKVISDAVNNYFKTLGTNKYEAQHDIILLADKESQYDTTGSDDVDYSVLNKHPEHVVTLGDYASATRSINDELYLYKGYSGVNKIFGAWGNHDGANDPTGQQFYNFYNQIKSYYSKVIGNVEFFFVDTLLKLDETGWDIMGDVQSRTIAQVKASTQGQWLINAMANSSAAWKVLVYHIPTWGSNFNLNTSPQMAWDWYDYGVDLILNSHFHFYERLLVNTGTGDVPIINCGTSGASQLTIGTPATGSIIRINDSLDVDFASGMFITMDESPTELALNLHAVDNNRNVIADKDTLVLNK